jgi:hypothetical protein
MVRCPGQQLFSLPCGHHRIPSRSELYVTAESSGADSSGLTEALMKISAMMTFGTSERRVVVQAL